MSPFGVRITASRPSLPGVKNAVIAPTSALSGNYTTHDERIALRVAADGKTISVVNTNGHGQQANGGCWVTGTGNVSADGRTLFVNASGAACAPAGLRFGTGRVGWRDEL